MPVTPALAGGKTAVVLNLHRREVVQLAVGDETLAQVEVLEIHEEGFVKASHGGESRRAAQQAGPAQQNDGGRSLRQVSILVAMHRPLEAAAQKTSAKAPQQQYGQIGVALAEILPGAVRSRAMGAQRHHPLCLLQVGQALGEGTFIEVHVGVENE